MTLISPTRLPPSNFKTPCLVATHLKVSLSSKTSTDSHVIHSPEFPMLTNAGTVVFPVTLKKYRWFFFEFFDRQAYLHYMKFIMVFVVNSFRKIHCYPTQICRCFVSSVSKNILSLASSHVFVLVTGFTHVKSFLAPNIQRRVAIKRFYRCWISSADAIG